MTQPEFPTPQDDDSDDVLLALKTARSLWEGGDHDEGLRWLRKAASAAEEAGDDLRAVKLASAAADLSPAQAPSPKKEPPSPPSKSSSADKPPQPPAPPKGERAAGSPSKPPTPPGQLPQPPPVQANAAAATRRSPQSGARPQPALAAQNPAQPGDTMFTQTLRVAVKPSARDDQLLVARLLDSEPVPEGTYEALVVLLDPEADLLKPIF